MKSWAIILVAVLQVAALGGILADRALILAHGREIILKSEPIDPRDLFRGDYVILGYDATRFDVADVAGDNDFDEHSYAYVVFRKSGADWAPAAITHDRPARETLGPDDVFVKAFVVSSYSTAPDGDSSKCADGCEMLTLSYGIESYFVPEGTGRGLEEARNEQQLEVVVAVRGDGRAAIKALMLDGEIVAREGIL